MAYTFSGVASNANAGGNSVSVTLSVGPTAGPFVVVAVHEQNSKTAGGSVTVGGVSLNPADIVDASGTVGIFSGVATGQSGSVTVTFTATASIAFETVGFSLWYTSDNVVKSHTASGASGTCTISVNNGDFLFGISEGAGALDWSGSTVTPTGSRVITGDSANGGSADWMIVAGASFTVSSARSFIAAATYAAPSTPAFTTIGIGGSEW